MKKGNVTILASIFVMALVAAGVGAGTMAWFSTTEQTTSTYTMNAATMNMVVTTTPVTFSNLVPGQTFGPITISIANTGTMDIDYMGGDLIITDVNGNPYSSDTASGVLLANYIEITDLEEYIPNYGWQESIGGLQHYETLVKDGSAPLTLMELAKSYWYPGPEVPLQKQDQFGNWVKSTTDWCTGHGYDQVPSNIPALAFGGTYQMVLRFKLSDLTPNTMQGASCSFKIVFTGVQQNSQLP
jgi:predicted ribosomally synthesized peptide with SipW-like signal peptide